jgi:hypothetical protein
MVDQLTWIPGTHSVWAAGDLDSGDILTALLKYGP